MFYGFGEVDGVSNSTISLGKSNISVSCAAAFWSDWGGFFEDFFSGTIIGRRPNSVANTSYTTAYQDPGNYFVARWYEISDQYGWVLGYEDTVQESWEPEGNNTCNITVEEAPGPAPVYWNGTYNDAYGNVDGGQIITGCTDNSHPEWQQCTSDFRQWYSISGQDFSQHVTFGCFNMSFGAISHE
jgi:hypothetical protein